MTEEQTMKSDGLPAALTVAFLRHIKEVVETKLDKAKKFGAETEWSEGFQSAFIDLIDEIDHLISIHEGATAALQNANSETENPC